MVQGRANSHSALSAQYRQYHCCLSVSSQTVEPLDHHPRTLGVQSSAWVRATFCITKLFRLSMLLKLKLAAYAA